MAPRRGPQEAASLQGKSCRVRGSVPFGGSNGLVCLPLLIARSTATAGAWPPPLARARTRLPAPAGVHDRTDGPLFGTLRRCRFAGEIDYGGGADAFGCADEFDWPREKYCPNGGMAFAHHHGVGLPGGPRGRSWPRRSHENGLICREKVAGVRGSVPFGGSDGLVCLPPPSQGGDLPQRLAAHGRRPAYHGTFPATARNPRQRIRLVWADSAPI
jgi:hypothetical protein